MSYLPNRNSRVNRRASYAVKRSKQERRRTFVILVVLLLLWSLCLGIGLAQATEPPSLSTLAQSTVQPETTPASTETTEPEAIGTVDVVPEKFQFGQKLYLENCDTCHIGIPPAVMPSETWRQLIQDPEHYGVTINPLQGPEVQILWQYMREYSRPQAADESTPYRIYQSRFFKALHPRVQFPQKVNLASCISCHPGAEKYDFRSLSAEWQNAP